ASRSSARFVDPLWQYQMELFRPSLAIGLDVPPRIRHLRTNELKSAREYRQAALFSLGMSRNLGVPVRFCPVEASDYDFIATWEERSTRHFAPIQLKELVPESLNSSSTIQAIIDGLTKYSSNSLTVGIFLNRQGTFDHRELRIPTLRIGALWFVFTTTQDQSQWILYGDILGKAHATTFEYPT
ncbi:hypothetical protein, partial [Xanthomonas floridensis]